MFRFEPNVVTLAVLAIREKGVNSWGRTYILKNCLGYKKMRVFTTKH